MTLKEIVKDNKVFFTHFRAGHFYYSVKVENDKFIFPVPLEDIGDATLLVKDKAMFFMRYIRKALDDKTFIKLK